MGDSPKKLAPGELLRFMRDNAGLSQRSLSSAIGRNASYMSIVERPSRDPSLSTVCRVAAACGYGLEVYEGATGEVVARLEAPETEE